MSLIIKKSPIHGYGVFAGKNYEKDDVIEECYAILANGKDKNLHNYYFHFNEKYGIPTGFGLIYNHADQPNAYYYYDELNKVVIFKASRSIKKEEEIFISYGKNWFSDRKTPVKKMSFWRKTLCYPSEPLIRAGIVFGGLIFLINLLHVLAER